MSNVALSSENKNTTQTSFTQLDIGGGPDANAAYYATPEQYKRELSGAHAVLLARANPDGSYIVLDPLLEMEVAKQVEAETPNVTFVEGQVDKDHKLPFDDGSMDVVEVNHLVSPLMMESHLKPEVRRIEHALEKKQADLQLQMITPAQLKQKLQPYQLEIEKVTEDRPEQLLEEGTAEDFKDYLAVMAEAARVLKPNGKLVLGEKWSRIKAIIRVISKDDRLQCDGEIMDQLGLEFLSLTDNDDSNRSGYANSAAWIRYGRIESGDMEGAEQARPLILTLQKRSDAK